VVGPTLSLPVSRLLLYSSLVSRLLLCSSLAWLLSLYSFPSLEFLPLLGFAMGNEGRHTEEEVVVTPVATRASTTHHPVALLLEGTVKAVVGGGSGGQRQHRPDGQRLEDRATLSTPTS
jgi:hypothetical protein